MRIQLIFILTVLLAVTSSAKPIDIFLEQAAKIPKEFTMPLSIQKMENLPLPNWRQKLDPPDFWPPIPMEKFYIPSVAGMKVLVHWDITSVKTVNLPNSLE